MRIRERTILALAKIVCGDPAKDGPISPYLSGPQLVALFQEYGFDDRYGQGFPSRHTYVEDKIRALNGTKRIATLVRDTLDPSRFIDTDFDSQAAADFLNKYLDDDGFVIVLRGKKVEVRSKKGAVIEFEATHLDPLSHEFITEQLAKCDNKIGEGDYRGAITNARSLVEAVLLALERAITGVDPDFDGDLHKTYKRVQKLLNLEPAREDISNSLRQVLTGLSSIVAGIAPMRNSMSDAHATTYRPARHHAALAVNASKTLVAFLFDTYEYQRSTGTIAPAIGS